VLKVNPASELANISIKQILDPREYPIKNSLIILNKIADVDSWLDLHFNSQPESEENIQKLLYLTLHFWVSKSSKNYLIKRLNIQPDLLINWNFSIFNDPLAQLQLKIQLGDFLHRDVLEELTLEKFGQTEDIGHKESATDSRHITQQAQIHPSSVVEGSIAIGVSIGPLVWIGTNTSIGENTKIDAGVKIYPGSTIGADSHIMANTVIGSEGFGYDKEGQHIPHLAGVKIEDRVSIGPQCVIASGSLIPTQVGTGSQLDSFVQIGHHTLLGKNVFMASQSGVGGSSVIGDNVAIAGGAQIKDHITIGTGAQIAAKAGVIKDVQAGMTHAGFPSMPIRKWHRMNYLLTHEKSTNKAATISDSIKFSETTENPDEKISES
tara:strand:+ start:1142 stop:2278 length:1137 start_codon:yes stop_codon:yes gene_type:complete